MLAGGVGLVVYRIRLLRGKRGPRILVFTEGTIIKEVRGGNGEMVGGTVLGNAAGKLKKWDGQGARIMYLSSRRSTGELNVVRMVLKKNGLPKGSLYFRRQGEDYKDVAERILPDVIVEDDCAGIGGEREMTYPHIRSDLKERIVSIVVREFEGIDQLPDSFSRLLSGDYGSRAGQ